MGTTPLKDSSWGIISSFVCGISVYNLGERACKLYGLHVRVIAGYNNGVIDIVP